VLARPDGLASLLRRPARAGAVAAVVDLDGAAARELDLDTLELTTGGKGA